MRHVGGYILEHIQLALVVEVPDSFQNIHVVDTVAPRDTRFHAVPSSTAKHLLPASPSVQNTILPAVPAEGSEETA